MDNASTKKLIDSLLRGYTLPLLYLHEKKEEIAGLTREGLEIIDGQQRLTSIYKYVEGDFRLFDPQTQNNEAKFPQFLVKQSCPWAGKYFHEFPPDYQEQLKRTPLLVVMIQSDDVNKILDLFVRLQAGSALNAQERRDAMPGV